MNLKLINVSTRKLRRAMRLPDGDLPAVAGDGTSKSAASRWFVALSAQRLAEWMASDLSKRDLLVIQIDGLHIGKDLVLVAADVSCLHRRGKVSVRRPRVRSYEGQEVQLPT
jgi:putative transposase